SLTDIAASVPTSGRLAPAGQDQGPAPSHRLPCPDPRLLLLAIRLAPGAGTARWRMEVLKPRAPLPLNCPEPTFTRPLPNRRSRPRAVLPVAHSVEILRLICSKPVTIVEGGRRSWAIAISGLRIM